MKANVPDVISLELCKGKARLMECGFVIGEIKVTQAPGAHSRDNLRIVKQRIRPDGRVDLIVVSAQSSFPGKEV